MNKENYEKMITVNRIMSRMRHDMVNMLNGITGFSEVISLKSEGKDNIPDHCSRIVSTCEDMAGLLENFSKFNGADRRNTTELDLHEIISSTATLLSFSLGEDILIETQLKAENPLINGEASEIRGLFLQLGKNSGEAMAGMDKTGAVRYITSNILLDEEYCRENPFELIPGEFIQIRITDTGRGALPTAVDQFFDPYYTTTGNRNRGLGLTRIFYQIISLNGEIHIESEEGQGTVVTINLPVVR
ncbi:MAG: hypothetical protein JEY99_06230 [Spirochaetales bacterium]|nr:hypothetical protein [Spirochaetales bacterium]